MDADDLEPKKPAPALRNLEPMSISELNHYICELEEEILRVKDAITKKEMVRLGAESLFKR
jgi:uncharacterized small protein (DUF1192 family)